MTRDEALKRARGIMPIQRYATAYASLEERAAENLRQRMADLILSVERETVQRVLDRIAGALTMGEAWNGQCRGAFQEIEREFGLREEGR